MIDAQSAPMTGDQWKQLAVPKSGNLTAYLNVRLPENMIRKLKALSQARKCPVSHVARTAIIDYLEATHEI
jgi:hypothetical protein